MPHQFCRRLVLSGMAATLVPISPRAQERPPAADGPRVLRAAPLKRKLSPDLPGEAETWCFDGSPAVPLLRVRHGEDLSFRLANDLPAPLSLHWQGVRGPNGADGVGGLTGAPVAPGASADIRFAPPDPGIFLARPMVPGRSGELAGRGLAALLVVDEKEPPAVDADYALLVRDWRLDPAGELAPFGGTMEAALAGRLGNKLHVDGSEAPKRVAAAPGARIRLRLVNGSNARVMRIRFDNLKVFVGAVDGQPTDRFEPLRASLPLPPGTRYDLFVEAAGDLEAKGAITALIGEGMPLVEIETRAGGQPKAPRDKPVANLQPNPRLPAEIRLQNALRKDVAIAGGATLTAAGEPSFKGDPRAIWTLNGAAGAATSPPLFTAKRGQPVVLALHNQTGFPQPVHLHGHVCRLLHGLDDGWEPYWMDTLQVPEGKTSRIAFVADNPGKWMLGSTILERLDTGLWGWFEVT